MRILLAFILSVPLLAQDTAAQAPAAPPAPAAPAAPAAAPSPAPSTDQWLTGSVDFGYQYRTDVGGSFDTYRSVVNLGSGPKLFGTEFTILDPHKKFFDRIDVRAYNWGGDPYNTAHVTATKRGLYDLNFDYRNIAYFNFLPSFADPTAGSGIFLNQRSFDTSRRMSDFQLDLFPGRRIVPYLAYSRDSGRGTGTTTFQTDANDYPVFDRMFDKTDNYRGGVRLEFNRFHVTLEQGGTTLRDDQQVFTDTPGTGYRTTLFLGQQLDLTNLQQAYGIRGDSIYSKALLTANPFSWIDLYGQFLYSRPETNVNYSQSNTGNFVLLDSLLFYTGEQALGFAEAKQPHTTGSVGFQLRPLKRVRIVQNWMTDRLHTAAGGLLTDMILQPASAAQSTPLPLASLLVLNYNQEQIEVMVDVTRKLTVRGGYRYVWGNAEIPASPLFGGGMESSELRQKVGLAGISFRTSSKFSANVDFEGASADHAYFRTSLYNYQRMRARARYQVAGSLALQAGFSLLNNQNPSQGIHYDFLSRQNSLSATWTPGGGKHVSVLAEYTRSTLHSDINYLLPQILSPALSSYRDNAHTATGIIDVTLPGYSGLAPRLSFGGSFFISSGSRPTSYYQPLVRLAVPLTKYLAWNSEYRFYGYGEPFYLYEGFHAHILQTGLKLSR
ncbi:MAG: hypothetical protein U0Q18_34160 [Bryobacteraceae bacterium]